MTNLLDDPHSISQLISNGKVVLCPTDTIWGLSCDAYNAAAVDKIYEIKSRDRDKPLILLVSNLDMLNKYITDLHPRVENLIDLFDKPLTVIHKGSDKLPEHFKSASNTIAIRLTRNDLLKEIIDALGRPIVSTSANIQGAPSPSAFDQIAAEIKSAVDYTFFTARETTSENAASTIIRYNEDGELFFIR